MKKTAAVLLLIAAIASLAVAFGGKKGETAESDYLRVHIRANSNGQADQAVKYRVRDAVVEYLTPVVADCGTKAAAMAAVEGRLTEIASVADSVLRANGFVYGARASLRRETFPTRVYEEVTLNAGVYDALILELGAGGGDNWWCVVYPPLCFTGGNGNVVYKSKIAEIVRKFFKEE